MVPVEGGGKFKAFPIEFIAFVFTNSKDQRFSDKTLKFLKI